MENIITIAIFNYAGEVMVPQSLLESEGIQCLVQGDMSVGSFSYLPGKKIGIHLKVLESDVPRAIEILKEGGFNVEEDGINEQ